MLTFSDSSPELVSRSSLDEGTVSDFSLVASVGSLYIDDRNNPVDHIIDPGLSDWESSDQGSYELIVIPGPETRTESVSTSVVAVASAASSRSSGSYLSDRSDSPRPSLVQRPPNPSPHIPRSFRRRRRRPRSCRSRTLSSSSSSSSSESGTCLTPSVSGDSVRGPTERPSTLQSGSHARRRMRTAQITHSGSVLSASEASSSINSFLDTPEEFMSEKANKLRLWQALCIELGLVELEGHDELPDLPSAGVGSSSSSASASSSRSVTPTQTRPPLPQTLNKARQLLKECGHVNIVEYLDARNDSARRAHHDGEAAGKYADLVHPSAGAMRRHTVRQKKFMPLSAAKMEWLEPLLRDFGYRRGRRAWGGV